MPVPILAYHLITDDFDFGFARSTLGQFRQQMAWLKEHGYRTLTLKRLVECQEVGTGSTLEHTIVLTFDDAYACLEKAAAIMEDFGFVGTCFPVAEFLGCFNSWDYQIGPRKFLHADAALLKSLIKAGWEAGSHSSQHANLLALSPQEVYNDLYSAKHRLEDRLGYQIVSISYPFGRTNRSICNIAARAGYKAGVSLGMRPGAISELGLLGLPRMGIYLFDNLLSFAFKVNIFNRTPRMGFLIQHIISSFSYGTILLKKLRNGTQKHQKALLFH